jgi:hypothetical protein
MRYYLFFTGRMEYARLIIISSPVGDFFQSWLFHLLLFIFYGSDGITHFFLIFTGVRELKVRQIDHNIISGW